MTACAYCGRDTFPFPVDKPWLRMLDDAHRHLLRKSNDHILPREWGGQDEPDNFRVSCQECNELRARCGHCVGALACVIAVADNRSRLPILISRWYGHIKIIAGTKKG
jgi:hypothetical protein